MIKIIAEKIGENFASQKKLKKNKAQEGGTRNKDRTVTENKLGFLANIIFVVRQRVF